jgi:hypothetical protein
LFFNAAEVALQARQFYLLNGRVAKAANVSCGWMVFEQISYKKRLFVQNKSNLLLKIFCMPHEHYNYL